MEMIILEIISAVPTTSTSIRNTANHMNNG